MTDEDLTCVQCGGRLFYGYDHSCPLNLTVELRKENAKLAAELEKAYTLIQERDKELANLRYGLGEMGSY